MAQIKDGTTISKQPEKPLGMRPRSSCFLGCFGGPSDGGVSPENQYPSKSTKLKKKSSPRRTVPFDEKVHQKKASVFLVKSTNKLHKDQTHPVPGIDKIVLGKPNKTKYDNVQEIILENRKNVNHVDSMMKATCKRAAICTSQKSIRNPTLPEDKFEVSRGKVALSYSVSMPPPIRKKTVDISGGDSKVNKRNVKTSQRKRKGDGGRFDQITGMSFILVTLTIMLFLGKLCAILCTSAWLYFYPFLRGKSEPKLDQESVPKPGDNPDQFDLNSPDYKKKVVLEGLLERNRRIH